MYINYTRLTQCLHLFSSLRSSSLHGNLLRSSHLSLVWGQTLLRHRNLRKLCAKGILPPTNDPPFQFLHMDPLGIPTVFRKNNLFKEINLRFSVKNVLLTIKTIHIKFKVEKI